MRVRNMLIGLILGGSIVLLVTGCGGGSNDQDIPSPFAGNYAGTYTGSEYGTWTAVCSTNGIMSASIHSPSVGNFTGQGTIKLNGEFEMETSGSGNAGPYHITWNGTFSIQNGQATGSGTWSSDSGFTGTWTGGRQ